MYECLTQDLECRSSTRRRTLYVCTQSDLRLTMMSSTAAVHESGNSVLMEMQGMSSSECMLTDDATAVDDIVGEEEDEDEDDVDGSVLIVTCGL